MEKNWKIKGFKPSQPWLGEAKSKLFGTLKETLSKYEAAKAIYNRFSDIRNRAAEIPSEYLKGVRLDGTIDPEELRELIVLGAEVKMEKSSKEMIEIERAVSFYDDYDFVTKNKS